LNLVLKRFARLYQGKDSFDKISRIKSKKLIYKNRFLIAYLPIAKGIFRIKNLILLSKINLYFCLVKKQGEKVKNNETSYPRNKIRILLLENISLSAVEVFKESGYVEIKRISGALSEEDLIAEIKGVHLLGIRSKTQITEKVIENADK